MRNLGPIRFGHVLLVHHGSCYFEDVPNFALGFTVLLWSMPASEFSPNSFPSEIHCEIVRELLLVAIRSQASYMSTNGFFEFVFKPLEVSEHFALLPHRIDPRVPREVVDEEHVISASAKCSRLRRSPYVGMDYVE